MDDDKTQPKITEDDYKLTSVTETAIKWLWIITGVLIIGSLITGLIVA